MRKAGVTKCVSCERDDFGKIIKNKQSETKKQEITNNFGNLKIEIETQEIKKKEMVNLNLSEKKGGIDFRQNCVDVLGIYSFLLFEEAKTIAQNNGLNNSEKLKLMKILVEEHKVIELGK